MPQVFVEGTVRHVDERSVSVFYRLEGEEGAPVLMFANSLGTDMDLWDEQVPEFAATLRVLRYDMRGHGRSPEVPGEYTVAELAADALRVLDALGIERVHFCGLSLGGMVGQYLGAHHPDRLASLTLCATACRIGTREVWDERIALVLGRDTTAVVDLVIPNWFTERFRQAEPRRVEAIREMLLNARPLGYAGCCAAVRDADLCGDLARIAVPTFCIAGRHDPVTPPERLEEIRERVRDPRGLAVLEAAHLVNVEARAAFNDALGRFLAEVGAL